jgi:anti-sigma B factor antagonist
MTMSQQQVLSVTPHEEMVLAVVLCNELDENLSRRMQEGVLKAAAEARPLPVVLDLSNVRFLASLSIGVLVSLLTEIKQSGQRFILVGIQPLVREMLAITRMDTLFEIHDNVDEALKHIGRA